MPDIRVGKKIRRDTTMEKQNKWQKVSNLEWSEPIGLMTWRKACKKCKEMGGRLPTRIELIDLYDNHQEEIKDWETGGYFWSATTISGDTRYAWYVALYYGNTYYTAKTAEFDSRCVRDIK
jgi:hypothetical protein